MPRQHVRHEFFAVAGHARRAYLPFQTCSTPRQTALFFIKDTQMSSTTITPVFATRPAEGLRARLWRSLRARFIANRTRAALSTLTPRELEDVGLTSADIDRMARRAAGL